VSQTDLKRRMPAGLYGSTKYVFGVLVAPNAPGCSNASGSPTGKSFDETMRNFELQRDREFSSHICGDHPRNTASKTESNSRETR
jgi:hypothetical protein